MLFQAILEAVRSFFRLFWAPSKTFSINCRPLLCSQIKYCWEMSVYFNERFLLVPWLYAPECNSTCLGLKRAAPVVLIYSQCYLCPMSLFAATLESFAWSLHFWSLSSQAVRGCFLERQKDWHFQALATSSAVDVLVPTQITVGAQNHHSR